MQKRVSNREPFGMVSHCEQSAGMERKPAQAEASRSGLPRYSTWPTWKELYACIAREVPMAKPKTFCIGQVTILLKEGGIRQAREGKQRVPG